MCASLYFIYFLRMGCLFEQTDWICSSNTIDVGTASDIYVMYEFSYLMSTINLLFLLIDRSCVLTSCLVHFNFVDAVPADYILPLA